MICALNYLWWAAREARTGRQSNVPLSKCWDLFRGMPGGTSQPTECCTTGTPRAEHWLHQAKNHLSKAMVLHTTPSPQCPVTWVPHHSQSVCLMGTLALQCFQSLDIRREARWYLTAERRALSMTPLYISELLTLLWLLQKNGPLVQRSICMVPACKISPGHCLSTWQDRTEPGAFNV